MQRGSWLIVYVQTGASLSPTPLCPWNSPGKNTRVGSHSLLRGDLPNPGIEARSAALQADSLPSELPGKPTIAGT